MSEAYVEQAHTVFTEFFSNCDDRTRRMFTEVTQDLYNHCFILREGHLKSNPRYAFIEKHEEPLAAYLAIGGWRLYLDRELGVARLHHPEGTGRFHFNKEETSLLLVLRLIYHEQKQTASEIPDIIVSVGTIRERMHSLLPDAAIKPFLSRKTMGSRLRRLEQFRIISFEKSSFQIDDDTPIILQPVLEHMVNSQTIEETQAKLKSLYSGTNNGADNNGQEISTQAEEEVNTA
ncbi:MAG: DUF4194 domain-containing protein [Bdellovibrionota bacterium]